MFSTATAAAAAADPKLNATTHGLTAATLILPGENLADYEQLRRDTFAEWKPQGATQVELTRELAEAMWRLRRVRRQEAAFFKAAVAAVRKEDPSLDHDAATAHLFLDKEYARKLSLFLRYQTTIERAFTRTLKQLQTLKHEAANRLKNVQINWAAPVPRKVVSQTHPAPAVPAHPAAGRR